MNKRVVNFENRVEFARPSWDDYFLDIAEAVSKRSHDAETKLGCVVIDGNKRIIATGYNGFPPGSDDTKLPNCRPDKYPFMVHAEMNAIASSRQDLRESTFYISASPCLECTKAIITAGVRAVVFRQVYQNDDFDFVKDLLTRCKIEVRHVPRSPK
jgi:dCMP deaminase